MFSILARNHGAYEYIVSHQIKQTQLYKPPTILAIVINFLGWQ